MTTEKIAITGMGAVTPIGIGVNNYWKNLLKSISGVSYITRFDASSLPTKIAAEVKNFNATDFLPKKLVRDTDIFMHFAITAAQEALSDSKLSIDKNRIAIVLGTAFSGISTITQTQEQLSCVPGFRISPHFVPKVEGNIAAAQIAILNGFKGPSLTINTACSSGADAVGVAAMLIQSDEADAALAVGAESIICHLMIGALSQAKALSTNNDDPAGASRPFDLTRDGFVAGEGGGAVILEPLENARKRNADIKALLLGYSSNTDGYHITSPDPKGTGEIRCMKQALQKAGLDPDDIDYINAHGTSTKLGDQIETASLKKVFGDKAYKIPVSSTKGATGHLMGAGGITELIACIQAIREGVIPPTINYKEKDPECDLDYVPNFPRKANVRNAMSNSFGFGGQNACLIVGKYEE